MVHKRSTNNLWDFALPVIMYVGKTGCIKLICDVFSGQWWANIYIVRVARLMWT